MGGAGAVGGGDLRGAGPRLELGAHRSAEPGLLTECLGEVQRLVEAALRPAQPHEIEPHEGVIGLAPVFSSTSRKRAKSPPVAGTQAMRRTVRPAIACAGNSSCRPESDVVAAPEGGSYTVPPTVSE